MCGRFTLRTRLNQLSSFFSAIARDDLQWPERYNIAPTQAVLGISLRENVRQFSLFRWGLIPSWAKDAKLAASMINARSETVAEKPAFRAAFKRRRCLIVADGYYEWHTEDGRKQPFHIRRTDGEPFAFGGLWEQWHNGTTDVDSATIITTPSSGPLADLHDRMPLVLAPSDYEGWLNASVMDCQSSQWLATSAGHQTFEAVPVSTYVNNARHEGEECLASPSH